VDKAIEEDLREAAMASLESLKRC